MNDYKKSVERRMFEQFNTQVDKVPLNKSGKERCNALFETIIGSQIDVDLISESLFEVPKLTIKDLELMWEYCYTGHLTFEEAMGILNKMLPLFASLEIFDEICKREFSQSDTNKENTLRKSELHDFLPLVYPFLEDADFDKFHKSLKELLIKANKTIYDSFMGTMTSQTIRSFICFMLNQMINLLKWKEKQLNDIEKQVNQERQHKKAYKKRKLERGSKNSTDEALKSFSRADPDHDTNPLHYPYKIILEILNYFFGDDLEFTEGLKSNMFDIGSLMEYSTGRSDSNQEGNYFKEYFNSSESLRESNELELRSFLTDKISNIPAIHHDYSSFKFSIPIQTYLLGLISMLLEEYDFGSKFIHQGSLKYEFKAALASLISRPLNTAKVPEKEDIPNVEDIKEKPNDLDKQSLYETDIEHGKDNKLEKIGNSTQVNRILRSSTRNVLKSSKEQNKIIMYGTKYKDNEKLWGIDESLIYHSPKSSLFGRSPNLLEWFDYYMIGKCLQGVSHPLLVYLGEKKQLCDVFPDLDKYKDYLPEELVMKLYVKEHIRDCYIESYGYPLDEDEDENPIYEEDTARVYDCADEEIRAYQTIQMYNNSQKDQREIIRTPRIFAGGQLDIKLIGPQAKFILMSYLKEDEIQLYDILHESKNKRSKKLILKKLLKMMKKLNEIGIRYFDVAARNVIITDNEPYIIDFEKCYFQKMKHQNDYTYEDIETLESCIISNDTSESLCDLL